MPVPRDSHVAEPHVHVDHQYLAVAARADPVSVPAHPFGWYGSSDPHGFDMPEDTKLLAKMLFEVIDDLACARLGAASPSAGRVGIAHCGTWPDRVSHLARCRPGPAR
jgi:hypothetical protein